MILDLEAARRQTLTTSFDPAEVEALLGGTLTMAPHGAWSLPTAPTWREDPFTDRNWQFQFHTLRWLGPLQRAAAKGDDAAYAMWLRWVRSWVEQNPPRSPASTWAWVDMADGIRAQQLCQAAPLIAERSPELLGWMEQAIRTHAEHLADPAHVGSANHALHQAESLFVCGRVLGEERLWELGLARISGLLHSEYDEQGMNAEGAVAYHHNNYLWWERTLRRVDLEGLPRPAGAERLQRAPEGLAHATRPDGTYVTIGDTDAMTPSAVSAPVTDYVGSGGAAGTPPERTVAVYDAGWVFARSGWGDDERPYRDQTYYTLRFGPARRVHGHADGTSLTYSARGVNWIVDPGKFDYSRSAARQHMTARSSHSLLDLRGRRVTSRADVRLLRRTVTPTHHDWVMADSSFGRIPLTRRVVWSAAGEYLVVIDDVSALRTVTAAQRWQLGPDVEVRRERGHLRLSADGQEALLAFLSPNAEVRTVRGQEDPFDGFVSTGWKQLEPATVVSAERAARQLRFVTVLAVGHGAAPTVEVLPEHGGGVIALAVSTGRVRERIRIAAADVDIEDLTPAR